MAGALKAMAEHITDCEIKIDALTVKVDCLVALFRARQEEEEDASQSVGLPRPATSTA
jgi:hypothetical protein